VEKEYYHAYFNASVKGEIYYISYIIFNKKKEVIVENTNMIINDNLSNKQSDSCMAEYLALNALLKKVFECGIKEIHIMGDNKSVIDGSKGKCKVKTRYKNICNEIIELKNKLKECNLQFIKRERNKIADKMSRNAFKSASKTA
jgi:ribonuclease HI